MTDDLIVLLALACFVAIIGGTVFAQAEHHRGGEPLSATQVAIMIGLGCLAAGLVFDILTPEATTTQHLRSVDQRLDRIERTLDQLTTKR